MVRYVKHIPGVEVSFTKGPREEMFIVGYDEALKQMTVRQTTKLDEIVDTVLTSTKSCKGLRGDAFSACVAEGVIDNVESMTDSKQELSRYRDKISFRLRNYTCADPEMETTTPIKSYSFKSEGKEFIIDSLLDTPHAKIWKSDNFISEEECEVIFLIINGQLIDWNIFLDPVRCWSNMVLPVFTEQQLQQKMDLASFQKIEKRSKQAMICTNIIRKRIPYCKLILVLNPQLYL